MRHLALILAAALLGACELRCDPQPALGAAERRPRSGSTPSSTLVEADRLPARSRTTMSPVHAAGFSDAEIGDLRQDARRRGRAELTPNRRPGARDGACI